VVHPVESLSAHLLLSVCTMTTMDFFGCLGVLGSGVWKEARVGDEDTWVPQIKFL
jgi:hypothetical protein